MFLRGFYFISLFSVLILSFQYSSPTGNYQTRCEKISTCVDARSTQLQQEPTVWRALQPRISKKFNIIWSVQIPHLKQVW